MSDMPKVKITYMVLMVIALLTLIAWMFVAFISMFAFDAPGSESDPSLWALIVPVWIYPVILLGTAIGSWLFYKRGKLSWAIVLICIPLALVLLYASAILLYQAAAIFS